MSRSSIELSPSSRASTRSMIARAVSSPSASAGAQHAQSAAIGAIARIQRSEAIISNRLQLAQADDLVRIVGWSRTEQPIEDPAVSLCDLRGDLVRLADHRDRLEQIFVDPPPHLVPLAGLGEAVELGLEVAPARPTE